MLGILGEIIQFCLIELNELGEFWMSIVSGDKLMEMPRDFELFPDVGCQLGKEILEWLVKTIYDAITDCMSTCLYWRELWNKVRGLILVNLELTVNVIDWQVLCV